MGREKGYTEIGELIIGNGAVACAYIPLSNVIGDLGTAWDYIQNGSYLVIAVGGAATNALFYNECGWAGHTAGSTPFYPSSSYPIDTLPGTSYYENAAGSIRTDTLYLATVYAYYAVNGALPPNWTNSPAPAAPAKTCSGDEFERCPCGSAYFYGEDSGTSSSPYGNNFHIGQLGYGTHEHFDAATGGDDENGAFFNKTGASNATWVYGYWLVSGMSGAPAGTSATEWGQQQAQAANDAFSDMTNYYGSKVKLILLADIEYIDGGLDYQDYANNQAIYTAFIDWIYKYSVAPGTYSSPNEWNTQTMGTNFAPFTPGHYWVADYPYSSGYPNQGSLTTDSQYWVDFPQTNEKAQIWQYAGTPTYDYDVARVLPG